MPSKYEVIKARRESDPEYKARLESYRKKYVENNADKEKERQRLVKENKRKEDKESYNAYMREWRNKNADSINAKNRERLLNDKEYAKRIRLQDKIRYSKNPLKHRSINLKTVYGITLDDYNKMYDKQNGKCFICSSEKARGGQQGLVVDHCHDSNKIRGLLCTKCNTGLGQFKDSIENLQKAIEYLKERG